MPVRFEFEVVCPENWKPAGCANCGEKIVFEGCIVPSLCEKCSTEKSSLAEAADLLKRLYDLKADGLATVTCKRDYTCKVVSFCVDRGYVEEQGLSLILTDTGTSLVEG